MAQENSVKLTTLPDDLRKIADRLLNKKFGKPIAGEVVEKTPETVTFANQNLTDNMSNAAFGSTAMPMYREMGNPMLQRDATRLGTQAVCWQCRQPIMYIPDNVVMYELRRMRAVCPRCVLMYNFTI